MKKGNVKILLLEIFLMVVFFFALFAPKIVARYLAVAILLVTTIVLKKLYRIKSNEYIYEKQVNILMVLFGLVYVAIYYALGLYFGFIRSVYVLSLSTFLRFILPFTIIIIFAEYLRKILLSQDVRITVKGNKINLTILLTYIIMVLVDLIIYVGVYDFSSLSNTLKFIGFVIFASLSCNLLYQYLTVRFGPKGIILYRLITILFVYIIPFEPDVYIFIRSFLRMVYPFIIYLILENTYAKSNLALTYRQRKRNVWTTSISLVIMIQIIMLISCQFKFGIIVVGSDSMTGTINKGDAIIYERYDGGSIKDGQVIMFEKNKIKIIHRAIKIRKIDGDLRITTKGDANKNADTGYIYSNDVKGLVRLRIKFIGWPTIWVNQLFNQK